MLMFLLGIVGILITILSCIQIYRRRHLYAFTAKCSRLPSICWPLIGNSLELSADAREVVKLLDITSKDFYRERLVIWLFTKPMMLIQRPEDARAVLNSRNCIAKHDYYRIMELLVGQGLFNAKPDMWRRHKKMLMPAFNKHVLDSYVPPIAERAQEFVRELMVPATTGRPFNLQKWLTSYSLGVFCETALGIGKANGKSKEHQEFLDCIDRLKELVVERMFSTKSIGFYLGKWAVDRNVRRDLDFMENFTQKVIRAKRLEMEEQRDSYFEDSSRRLSFLELVLKLTDGSTFSEKQCCDEVTTFLFAGSDTSSATVGFTLLAMGMCPDIQALVHKELDQVFSGRDPDDLVDLSDLPKLVYLERVIKETMRLFPAAILIARKCEAEVKLEDGLTIPPGVDLSILIYNIHRDPEIWPDPLKFDPDRFLPSEVEKRHPFSYIPFSAGPRNCIGNTFAMTSMKVTLSTLLRTYEVRVPPNRPQSPAELELEMYFVTRPVGGFVVELHPRNNNNNNNKIY